MKRKDSFQKTFNATYNKKINYNWKEKERKNSVLIGGQETGEIAIFPPGNQLKWPIR